MMRVLGNGLATSPGFITRLVHAGISVLDVSFSFQHILITAQGLPGRS